jgi:hypothetical protein
MIYTVAEHSQKGNFHQVTIYELCSQVARKFSVPVANVEITDALLRMYRKNCIEMRNFRSGSDQPDNYTDISKTQRNIDDFFYRGSLQIRITADGRPDFESKSALYGSAASKPLIFISCGQFTNSEIALGERLCEIVEGTGVFSGYFAQKQQSLAALTANVFVKLEACVGFVAVMHQRGQVSGAHDDVGNRASLFIEQEIGIISFLMQTRHPRTIDVAGYIHRGITLEGIRKYIPLNPIEFTDENQVIEDFASKVKLCADRFRN